MKHVTNLEMLQAFLFLTVFIGLYIGARQSWPDDSLVAFVAVATVIMIGISISNRRQPRPNSSAEEFWSHPVPSRLTSKIAGFVLSLWAISVALIMGVFIIAMRSIVVGAFAILALMAAAIYGQQLRHSLFRGSILVYGLTLFGALIVFLMFASLVSSR